MTEFTFETSDVHFTPYPAQWKKFTEDRDGDVGQYLMKRGTKLALLAKQSVGKETGALAASIEVRFFPGHNPFVMIGSENSKAYMVHEGTRPHEEFAKPGKLLRFTIRGRVVYAREVHHPGTAPQKYLTRHLRKVI